MAVAATHSVALRGAVGHLIDIQADVSTGMVGTTLVGRVDSALAEAKDRVRMAISNSELDWPSTRRVTVLLSPADLPKSGAHFDLAIAVAIMAAAGSLDPRALAATAFVGELSLDGALRSVAGVLPMALAARQRGVERIFVPEPQVREASMVPDLVVFGVRSLPQVVAVLNGDELPEAPPVPPLSGGRYLSWRGAERLDELDMADLVGLDDVKYAVEVAAAGGHHLLLDGPKGCGKTSIAERIPTILPDLSRSESIELTAIRSLAGVLDPEAGLERRPPFSAPHHDASKTSLVGGGSGRVRPGELSLAHGGVLFLDEFPLFRTDVIEALREPLESGDITVARVDETITMPARSLVVLAANPCPCGNYGGRATTCNCTSAQRRDYENRIRGPIADRIDITRHLRSAPLTTDRLDRRESSAAIRERVAAARERQAERYADQSWRLNAHAPGAVLRRHWPLPDSAQRLVDGSLLDGRLSRRGAVKVHRLAWTIADLRGLDRPGYDEVQTALWLRQGTALAMHDVARRAAG
ncbi:YifB family Mg chelatase-like AAA ATPase [Nocardioides sp.]|jgi:magnesium chelatase family protein|uniref:YifB family Mg chelatase-like AAA ATPase n=1 Tax=Nocardioides sp. TaxID=35761 RepID=UPI002C70EE6D|nr:YifB family Mg chelatase-like AAA ATPase [Nocardioides sp.]HVX53555.1 YifB family Mg chelatase-like AAA ATPase [Nocardioides sp.]